MTYNMEHINPLLFGLIAGMITYIVLYLDFKFENSKIDLKKINDDGKCKCPSLFVTLKLPLIMGGIVWAIACYFENLKCIDVSIDNKLPYLSDSTSVFDQDVFTDMPDF